jgi:hypothetical protein
MVAEGTMRGKGARRPPVDERKPLELRLGPKVLEELGDGASLVFFVYEVLYRAGIEIVVQFAVKLLLLLFFGVVSLRYMIPHRILFIFRCPSTKSAMFKTKQMSVRFHTFEYML